MSEFSTPLPSGLRVRDIKVKTVNGAVVPDLDADGHEQEVWAVQVPQAIEAAEGTASERKAVVDGFVSDIRTKGADIALVRANARKAKQDPDAAETTFKAGKAAEKGGGAAQQGGNS